MNVLWIVIIIALAALATSAICIIATINRRKKRDEIIEEISYSGEEKRKRIIRLYNRTIKSHTVFLFFHVIKIVLSLVVYFVVSPQWIFIVLAVVLSVAVIKVIEDIQYMKSVSASVLDKEKYIEWLASPKY